MDEVEDNGSNSAMAEELIGHQARLYKLCQRPEQAGVWEGYGEIWHVELMQPEQLSQHKQVPTLRLLSKSPSLQQEISLEVEKHMLAPNHGDTYVNFTHEGAQASLSLADCRLTNHLREVLGCGAGADVAADAPAHTATEDSSCATQARRLGYDHSDAPLVRLETLSAVVDYAVLLLSEREEDGPQGEGERKERRQGQGKSAQVHPMTSLAVWLSGYSAVPPIDGGSDHGAPPSSEGQSLPLPLPLTAPCVALLEVLQEAMDLGDEEVRGHARILAEAVLQAMAGDFSTDLQEFCLLDHVFPTLYNAYLPDPIPGEGEGEGGGMPRAVHPQEGLTRRVLGKTVADKLPAAVLYSMEQVARATALIALPCGSADWHGHLTTRLDFLIPELVDKLLACEQLWKDGDAFFARFYNTYGTSLPASDAETLEGWLSLYTVLINKGKGVASRPGCLALIGQSQLFAAVDAALRARSITVDTEQSNLGAPVYSSLSSLHTLALRLLTSLLGMEGGAALLRKAECRQDHTVPFLDNKDRDSKAEDGSCMSVTAKMESLLHAQRSTLLGPCLLYSLGQLAYTARDRGVAEGAQECIRTLSNVAADHTGAENAGILPSGSSPLLRVAENRAFLDLYCAEHLPWLLLPWGDGVLPPLQCIPAAQALTVLQNELQAFISCRLSYSRRMSICERLCPGIRGVHTHVTQAHAFSLAQLELLQAICQPSQVRTIYARRGAAVLLMKGLVSRNKQVASATCRWFRQWLAGEEADALAVLDLCDMHNIHTALVVGLLVHAGQDSLVRVELCDLLLALTPTCAHDRWGPLKVLTEPNNRVMPAGNMLRRYGQFVSECARIRVSGLGSCRGKVDAGIPLILAPQLAAQGGAVGGGGSAGHGRGGSASQATPTPADNLREQMQDTPPSSGFPSRDSPYVSAQVTAAARKGLLGMGSASEGLPVLSKLHRPGQAGAYKGPRTVSPTQDGSPSGTEGPLPPLPGLSPDRSRALGLSTSDSGPDMDAQARVGADGAMAEEGSRQQAEATQAEPSVRSPQHTSSSSSSDLSPSAPSPVQPLGGAQGEGIGHGAKGIEAGGGTWLQDEFSFVE